VPACAIFDALRVKILLRWDVLELGLHIMMQKKEGEK
jgi:hypothetical protein